MKILTYNQTIEHILAGITNFGYFFEMKYQITRARGSKITLFGQNSTHWNQYSTLAPAIHTSK